MSHASYPLGSALDSSYQAAMLARPDASEAIPLARIARSFGQAAPHYDAHAGLQRQVADQLMARIPPVVPAAMLDLGCGTGYCSSSLRVRFPRASLCALDVALPMLHATAARHIANLDLVCADAQALPLRADAFDLVVSSLAMQWCFSVARLFAELRRVTRPGGTVLLSTFGPATLQEVRTAWAAVDGHVHVNGFATLPSLEDAARHAGFVWQGTSELRERRYQSLRAVARELKGIGAHNMNAGQTTGLTGRVAFGKAEQQFQRSLLPGEGIPVTWEVFYLTLHKPGN
jgi:malonyl-CoA O-methyltransferase